MSRADLDAHFRRIDNLVEHMDRMVPEGGKGTADFRGDLAGLLVVAIVASYETCVKEVMINFASRKHSQFEVFVANEYSKLSSRVAVSDLHRYAQLFGHEVGGRFKSRLNQRSDSIGQRTGVDIKQSYSQLLNWRHDFAHAGKRNTTIDEAMQFHCYGKRVLYAFDEAFARG